MDREIFSPFINERLFKAYDSYQVLGMASFLDHQDLTSKALLLLGHTTPIQKSNWMSLKPLR